MFMSKEENVTKPSKVEQVYEFTSKFYLFGLDSLLEIPISFIFAHWKVRCKVSFRSSGPTKTIMIRFSGEEVIVPVLEVVALLYMVWSFLHELHSKRPNQNPRT